jgi:hypothetical protein
MHQPQNYVAGDFPFPENPGQLELPIPLPPIQEESTSTKAQELTVKVFNSPEGMELLGHWMALAGITNWIQPVNQEHMIRLNEHQRFVHAILKNLAMTPDQIREATIARQEQRYTRRTSYE